MTKGQNFAPQVASAVADYEGQPTNIVLPGFGEDRKGVHGFTPFLDANPACRGKTYFITNGEPKPLREIIDRMVGAAGLPPVAAAAGSPRAGS